MPHCEKDIQTVMTPGKLTDAEADSIGAASQPQSIPNSETHILDLVIADLHSRDLIGRYKYGTSLQINDGRDHLIDLYQELLDAAMYIRQEIEQRKQDRIRSDIALQDGIEDPAERAHAEQLWTLLRREVPNSSVGAILKFARAYHEAKKGGSV